VLIPPSFIAVSGLRFHRNTLILVYNSPSFMHDVVHDAAILIVSRDHNMLVVRADGGLRE
jgi:hypothetical protein